MREGRLRPPPDRGPLPTRVNELPPLPDEFSATLTAALPSLRLELDAGQLERLAGHVRLMLAWNEAINLTAIRDPAAAAMSHVVDSLTAVALLREMGIRDFVDIGTGAGFPGIPLAIALPARRALLVESVAKKAHFVTVARDALDLAATIEVAAVRAEALAADPADRGRWACVVARAVTNLAELAELALPLLRPGGVFVAWKSEPIGPELEAAERALRQLGGEIVERREVPVRGLEGHLLIAIRKTAETPARYPREPAARRRKPL